MALTQEQRDWVDALRSGEYDQAEGSLAKWLSLDLEDDDNYGFCCLGVACTLNPAWGLDVDTLIEYSWTDLSESDQLTPAKEYVGLQRGIGSFLVTEEVLDLLPEYEEFVREHGPVETNLALLNDGGRSQEAAVEVRARSFAEIADIIEREPEGLFV